MSGDIVQRFIELLLEQAPGIEEASALAIERQLRHEYGGTEPGYIAKTCSEMNIKKRRAAEDLRKGESPAVVRSRHGISRHAIYRLLNKK